MEGVIEFDEYQIRQTLSAKKSFAWQSATL
jgi:hypothetical protein